MRRRIRLGAAVAAAGAALALIPAGASAATATTLEAQPLLLKLNDVNVQGRVPLRPSAYLYQSNPKTPLAGQVVQFFAAGQDLCAARTDVNGYAECEGIVRVTFPLLNLGYKAVFPGNSTYARSVDFGPLITIGKVAIGG